MSSIPRVSSTGSELNDFTEDEKGKKIYNVSKSRLVGLINWVHVVSVYLPLAWVVIIAWLGWQIVNNLQTVQGDLVAMYLKETEYFKIPREMLVSLGWKAALLLGVCVVLTLYCKPRLPSRLFHFRATRGVEGVTGEAD